ncbi:hypothetical protein [Rhodoferax sp.]|uniref:hypothetical protein n=1 Tax=Rhodoferax sp. TaxID=50421 RepID=UPI0025EFCDDD|nr:hypothetical protein [Rhodoferax sp.]MCM2295677.1 XdhC family protein [Rhodoferax sp.]
MLVTVLQTWGSAPRPVMLRLPCGGTLHLVQKPLLLIDGVLGPASPVQNAGVTDQVVYNPYLART